MLSQLKPAKIRSFQLDEHLRLLAHADALGSQRMSPRQLIP